MAYVLGDGVAVYYEVHGTGPAILLSHGFAARGRMWSAQLNALKSNYRVILWDLRGHGRSESLSNPADCSPDATLGDMIAILDSRAISKAIIGRHSLGGYMPQAFYVKHRERVEAFLLCCCGPGYRKAAPREARNAIANRLADELERADRSGLETAVPNSIRLTTNPSPV